MTGSQPTPLEELAGLLRGQRRRWRNWFAGLLLLMLAIGVNQIRIEHIATEARNAAHSAQEAIDLVLAQRVEARLNTCLKDKKFADAHNQLVYALTHTTVAPRSAKEQAIADQFGAQQMVPVPDCTPAGIAAFYAGQGGTLTPSAPDTTTTTSTVAPVRRRTTATTHPPASSSTTRTTATNVRPSSTTTKPCDVSVPVPGVPCV